MTDRSVVYRLRAEVGQFKAQMAQAGASVKMFGDDLTGLDAKGEKMRRGLDELAGTSGRIGLALGAAFATSVVKAANFEQAMSFVQAATHETAQNMDQLRQAALDAGQATAFSATEAAAGIEELAKAGVSTEDILGGGLTGALDLAAAGGLSVAEAAETAASAMTQFKLSGQDVGHIADLLAAGAARAQGDVTDLGQALNQSGLVAAQTGLTIEETTGALSAFASAGLLGSDAGTSFKQLLLSLNPSSKQAAELMKTLGISAYDTQGNFIGLAEFAGKLRTGLKDLSTEQRNAALKTIFGSDAIRAASILYEQGAKGIGKWTKNVDEAGYASDQASIRMDNLKGDVEQLGGALETALIGAGTGSDGVLRGLTQDLTSLVNAFNDLPEPAKEATGALTGLTALGAGGFWFTSKAVTSIADTRQALTDLGLRSSDAEKKLSGLGKASRVLSGAGGLALVAHGATQADDALGGLEIAAGGVLTGFALGGPWGAAIGGTAGALVGLAKASDNATESIGNSLTTWQTYRDTLDEVSGATTRATKAMVIQDLQQSGLLAKVGELGIDPQVLVNGILGQGKAREKLAAALQQQKNELIALGKAEYEKHKDDKNWDRDTADFLQRRWDMIDAIENETGELKEAAKARIEEIALINDLPEEVVTEFVTNAPETAGDVAALAEQYDLTPKQIKTVLDLLGINATMADIKRAQKALHETDGIHANPTISVDVGRALQGVRTLKSELAGLGSATVNTTGTGGLKGLLGGKRSAAGGLIVGPGGPTDDLIPTWLSNREYVVKASAVERYGVSFFDALNAERLATGGQPGKSGKPRKNEVAFLGWDMVNQVPTSLKGFIKSLEASKKALEDEISTRESLSSALSSAVSSKITSDLFGATDVWSKGGTFEDVMAQLSGDIASGNALSANIAALQGKGLDGPALDALLAQGDSATIANFAALTAAQLDQYEQQYETRNALATAVGQQASAAAGYTAQIVVLQAKVDQTNALLSQLNGIQKAIEKDGPKKTGHEAAKASKKGAARGARNAKRG